MTVKSNYKPGLVNAITRNGTRFICDYCGFPMPKYPGRYPKCCPGCGEQLQDTEGRADAAARPGEGFPGGK